MDDARKRTWAEINLDNLEHNYRDMRAHLREGTRFLGVVKANAYGHGALQAASLLQELGCDYLAVACLDEALELRRGGVSLPILILGYTSPDYTRTLIENDITQSLSGYDMAAAMSGIASETGRPVKVHLKIDTGMGRMGFDCRGGRRDTDGILSAMKLPFLDIEGIFTHFAVSDDRGREEYTEAQFGSFCGTITDLEAKSGLKFKIRHCTNSGAMINYSGYYLDMVRPGIAMYGCYPDRDRGDIDLLPVMELKTRVVQVKDFLPGDCISYGCTYTADSPRRIAVIPIGYADGLHRVLSNKMQVLIRGRRARQVGRICMDMCMIDVTDIPGTAVGDIVTVFGRDGDELLPVDEQAALAGTISYELLCAVAPRVPRIYIRRGTIL